MQSSKWNASGRWLSAAAVLAGIVAFYHRLAMVNPTTVVLSLLLFILILAARWGLRYAIVASIAAAACYNFYFLPPLGTFVIADPQNWLALLAFLVTSVVASRLSARARQEALEAKARQMEIDVLYRLGRELLMTENVGELLHSAPETIAHVSGARSVTLYLAETDHAYSSTQATPTQTAYVQPGGYGPGLERLRELSGLRDVTILDHDQGIGVPLRSGVRPRGVLVVRGLVLSDETMEAIGGLVSISIDRAEALEEVTRSEAAKSSEKLRTMMMDSITHELRTPLTAIKVSATTLLSSAHVDEDDRRDLLMVINEESDRLNRLVAQAVEMAQLDTHEVQMRVSAQSMAAIVERAVESCDISLEGRTVMVNVAENLPRVMADPVWMQKVICNLLENAAKYSPVETQIDVCAEVEEQYIVLRVVDRGMGIDASEQELIFDKFYRGRTRAKQIPGTGMGLAICRAILEAHEGTIRVASLPGEGATFTVNLPVARGRPGDLDKSENLASTLAN